MSQKKKKISYFRTNVTSVVSVTMVLLLLGIVALIGISAQEMSREIKENIGFDISMKEDATSKQTVALKKELSGAAYTSDVKYVSKEEALQFWEKETGENLIEVLGFNPLTAEFEVHVKSEYANIDSLNKIEKAIAQNPAVDEVKVHRYQVESVNDSLGKAAVIFFVVAVAMMIISLALINNTVRMTVYSRRFLIHTMKLVGATPGFIRKPIIVSNIFNGILASIIAMIILAGLIYYLSRDGVVGLVVTMFLPTEHVMMVFGLMVVVGVVLCSIAAYFAANKYINLDYDRLF